MAPTPVNKKKKGGLKSTQKGYTKTPFSTATRRSMSSVPGPTTARVDIHYRQCTAPNISSEQRVRTSSASGGASVASHNSNRSQTSSHAVGTARNTPAESVAPTGSTNRQGTDGNEPNLNPRAPNPSESGTRHRSRDHSANSPSVGTATHRVKLKIHSLSVNTATHSLVSRTVNLQSRQSSRSQVSQSRISIPQVASTTLAIRVELETSPKHHLVHSFARLG